HDEEEDEAFAEMADGDDEISDPTLAQFEGDAARDDEEGRDSEDHDEQGTPRDTRLNTTASAQVTNVRRIFGTAAS
ncbi:hypothetical protein LTR47_012134, partial [Exophiala xenobiotica]